MPIFSTVGKATLAAAACATCVALARDPDAITKTEKIIGIFGCGLCLGGAGSSGYKLVKSLLNPSTQVQQAVNQVQQRQGPQIKTPPKTSAAERALANRAANAGGRRVGFVTLVSSSGEEQIIFGRFPKKKNNQQSVGVTKVKEQQQNMSNYDYVEFEEEYFKCC